MVHFPVLFYITGRHVVYKFTPNTCKILGILPDWNYWGSWIIYLRSKMSIFRLIRYLIFSKQTMFGIYQGKIHKTPKILGPPFPYDFPARIPWSMEMAVPNTKELWAWMSRVFSHDFRFKEPWILMSCDISNWMFPKIVVPQNHPFVHRVFHSL